MFEKQDGWHIIPDDPQQHFIFNEYSLCKKYEKLPNGSNHDNDPLKHCENCQKRLDVIQSIGSKARAIKMKDLFNLIDNFDPRELRKANQEPTKIMETVVAVITSQDGKKRTISN